MDKEYICYCGLCCENCAVKAKINPAAKVLYDEMKSAGFEEIIHYIPGGPKTIKSNEALEEALRLT